MTLSAKVSAKLEQAKALLANADDESLSPEARLSYQAKAMTLISKYGLEAAMAASNEKIKPEATKQMFVIEGVYHQRRAYLLDHIAKPLGCQTVLSVTRGRQKSSVLVVYGMPSDLLRVSVLWSALNNHMMMELRKAQADDKKLPKWEQTHGKTLASNFIVAYANKIMARLEEAEKKALDDEVTYGDAGAALVLFDNETLVLNLFEKECPNLRTSRMRVRGSGGWAAGSRAGERAELGSGSRVSSGSGRLALGFGA